MKQKNLTAIAALILMLIFTSQPPMNGLAKDDVEIAKVYEPKFQIDLTLLDSVQILKQQADSMGVQCKKGIFVMEKQQKTLSKQLETIDQLFK